MRKYYVLPLLAVIVISLSSFRNTGDNVRHRIDLKGTWLFRLDSLNEGINKKWQLANFAEQVQLPGTTDINQKGNLNIKDNETTHLSRIYSYAGKAWYKKQVDIPKEWRNKHISLVLERTKPTTVWVDGKLVGTNDNISTAQVYDLSSYLLPGKHQIAISVDNGASVPPQIISNSHAYTESTQTNWNGIIGELYMEATNKFYIKDIKVYPNTENKSVRVRFKLSQTNNKTKKAKLILEAKAWNTDQQHHVQATSQLLDLTKDEFEIEYPLGDNAQLWSEFNPALYQLRVVLENDNKESDCQSVNFGLRDFKVQGTQFTINGNITMLRGKHDACVFPLTAHVAMDVDAWRHYFQRAKQYGINHYRFHSWCPPKACFEAADVEGIYLQPELPFWGTFKKEDQQLITFLSKEGVNIQNEYGNHASFVMFALGNELSGDQQVMDKLIATFRKTDNRHLYAFGANNYLGYNGQISGEDFLTTCRIGGAEEKSFATHTRASFSFADAYDGGYINHTYPNSVADFSNAISKCTVPVIGHETGQYQIYPNYEEIKKYTGVLKPKNFEVFRKRLEQKGMLDQADDFFKASGKLATILYRADIEMCLRTAGFGGFQLLDLQDYPGQGSAFVGILDAFMDSKGLIEPKEWRNFCSSIVPLFISEKFCWTNSEMLEGTIKIANYSDKALLGKTLEWKLTDTDGKIVNKGLIDIKSQSQGLIDLGKIECQLQTIDKAQKVTLNLEIAGTDYANAYPLWIYPAAQLPVETTDIIVTDKLDATTLAKLSNGESVLWFPNKEQYGKSTVGGLFQTDYWNYRMFKTICENINKPVSPGTLGILTNPAHPIFNDFPTDAHTNWQWFSIIKSSYPLIMDRMPAEYRPIVQVIDNVERNHKLGLIFEFRVNKGKLLVCMADLTASMDKPETKQLFRSMINYMKSDTFAPTAKISTKALENLFNEIATDTEIELLENISYK